MPPAVDVAPLAFVSIDDAYQLSFDFLCMTHPAELIKADIQQVRENGTRVLLSILDSKLATVPNVDAFATEVAQQALAWGVDGVDLDYEPPDFSPENVHHQSGPPTKSGTGLPDGTLTSTIMEMLP